MPKNEAVSSSYIQTNLKIDQDDPDVESNDSNFINELLDFSTMDDHDVFEKDFDSSFFHGETSEVKIAMHGGLEKAPEDASPYNDLDFLNYLLA
ncbi:hypothetical protein Nepgr_031583 [Nepenthes gracilis]|uniref:Uncharacterized protein n=1 Tax=Nepenthes gracilis TaxID=150966 RepID=A0AAD3THM9_NEPGR|nr:hypothetical protein Nepgr_031583 [Nepenthes gracilis]